MTDIATLDDAIAKHAKWKHYLRQAVTTGQSEWNSATVRRGDQCEFGEWLARLPQSERQGEDCRQIVALHTQLHLAAAEVLELALTGRQEEAAKCLAVGGNFTKVSSELVVTITAWKRKLLASN